MAASGQEAFGAQNRLRHRSDLRHRAISTLAPGCRNTLIIPTPCMRLRLHVLDVVDGSGECRARSTVTTLFSMSSGAMPVKDQMTRDDGDVDRSGRCRLACAVRSQRPTRPARAQLQRRCTGAAAPAAQSTFGFTLTLAATQKHRRASVEVKQVYRKGEKKFSYRLTIHERTSRSRMSRTERHNSAPKSGNQRANRGFTATLV